MKNRFPHPQSIPWDKINSIRVSSDQNTYSFEFDLRGKKQKMTIAIAPGSTSFTLSTDTGNPIVHATQKGREIKVLDFTSKLSLKGAPGKLRGVKVKKAVN